MSKSGIQDMFLLPFHPQQPPTVLIVTKLHSVVLILVLSSIFSGSSILNVVQLEYTYYYVELGENNNVSSLA